MTIRAKKSLGQNFLTDKRVVDRIVQSIAPEPRDIVIEVGPGTGALTRPLARQAGLLVAIEADSRLVEKLRPSALPNVRIVHADAMEVDWGSLIDSAIVEWGRFPIAGALSPRVRAAANLPYYISTPIIQLLLGHSSKLYDMTLMLQDEVVDRIAAAPTGKEYGYLSVLVQYYCEIKKLFKVPPSAFTPAPKVWSAVVRLSTRERPIVEVADEAAFFGLVRACFAQRRKTLLNNLKAAQATLGFGHDVDSIESALSRAGIDPRRRAETLTIGDFALLYDALFARAG